MSFKIVITFYAIFFANLSNSQTGKFGTPVVNAEEIITTNDTVAFWKYHDNHLKFSENFLAFDEFSQKITKKFFLQQLCTTKYFPVELSSETIRFFKLYKVEKWKDDYIPDVLNFIASNELVVHKWVGEKFPEFTYSDMNGKIYSTETTKNKILVLKFWFINCPPCVKEMPNLNVLVDKYKNNKDVEFISLALDSKSKLEKFLLSKDFKYAIIPNQDHYVVDDLQISLFPTHMVVDKDGIIVSSSTDYINAEMALKSEIEKSQRP